MQKRFEIFKNPCVLFQVIRPLNLRRQNLKLLKIKWEKTTDVPAWASPTSKDTKEIIFSTIANMVQRLYTSFWKCKIFRRLDYKCFVSLKSLWKILSNIFLMLVSDLFNLSSILKWWEATFPEATFFHIYVISFHWLFLLYLCTLGPTMHQCNLVLYI